jgi:preprotein translocase subunit SecE
VADREMPADESRDPTEPSHDSMQSGDDVVESPRTSSNGRTEDGASDGDGSGDAGPLVSNGRTEDGASDGDGNGDAGPLVSVGAPRRRSPSAATGSTTPVKAGRESKGRATPSQRQRPAKRERTGPVRFVQESIGELRKVVYPTGQQVLQYFVVVLVFVLFVIAYVSLLDLGFGTAIFKIFS